MANHLSTRSFSDVGVRELGIDVLTAAQSRSPLLITGDRDAARLIARLAQEVGETYNRSSRFVVVNPDVLSESLAQLSADSLGHGRGGDERGASQEHWTLCIEDVDQLTPSAQALLLRFLDVVCAPDRPPGTLWVIATAAADLRDRVGSEDFLEDLFYRLNVLHLVLSSARAGTEELPSSLDCLTSELAKDRAVGSPRLSVQRLHELLASDLPVDAARLQPLLASVSSTPSA